MWVMAAGIGIADVDMGRPLCGMRGKGLPMKQESFDRRQLAIVAKAGLARAVHT